MRKRHTHKRDFGDCFAGYHPSMARSARDIAESMVRRLVGAGLENLGPECTEAFEEIKSYAIRSAMRSHFMDVVFALVTLFPTGRDGNERIGHYVRQLCMLWHAPNKRMWSMNSTIGEIVELLDRGGMYAKT